jgi:predicted PurR-regulated permease PerM
MNQQLDSFNKFLKTRRFKLFLVVILFVVLIVFIYKLSHIFNPVLLGALMAYIFEPLISCLVRRGVSRPLSIICVYILMLLISALSITLIGVGVERQVEELAHAIPDDVYEDANNNLHWDPGEKLLEDHNGNGRYDLGYYGRFRGKISELILMFNMRFPSFKVDHGVIQSKIKESLDKVVGVSFDGSGTAYMDWVLQSAGGLGLLLMSLILIPIYAFFIQTLIPSMQKTIPALIPEALRSRSLRIFSRIDKELSAFFRGKIIVCLLKGALTYIGLQFCDLRFAFFIGFLAGILSVIPYAGAVLGVLMAWLIHLLDAGSFSGIMWILFVFVLMEVIEFFLNMIVFGKEVGIHPFAFILALFIGGELLGLLGVIMAVPLVSVVTILYKEFLAPILEELATQPDSPSV